ncbi:MAG: hypothetical protein HYW27_01485 [Candidatus Aenigmarchaeota archaeon]|nr:hypothetical protein [Candidatus Aenigmarchaeota archaeon]
MVQNRNKLIGLFIGNLANSVLHSILEKAVNNEELSKRYSKELLTSLHLAQKYREKINPANASLNVKDVKYIKDKVIRKVKSEIHQRTEKGYSNLDVKLVGPLVEKALKETKITE